MTLSPTQPPGGNFDLRNWKITLPVDGSGSISGTAVEVKDLAGYQNSKYFYTAPDGAMVFYAPVDGATTSGSQYARSELREMNGTAKAEWTLSTGGSMVATLEVDQAALRTGQGHKVIVGQIHGQDDELVRLYWHDSTLYFMNDQAGSGDQELTFQLKDASGANPNVSLNEKFSYAIDAKGDTLSVKVFADGKVYSSTTTINDVWDDDRFYFKAGAYNNANEDNGSGASQTSFYDLRFSHAGALTPADAGTPTPTPEPVPAPVPEPDPVPTVGLPVTTKTVSGSNSHNYVIGGSGNDLLKGNGGRDVLWGKTGSDVMWGGADSDMDAFVFDTALGRDVDYIMDFNPAHDVIRLENKIFGRLTKTGTLSSSVFEPGAKAGDANDHIVYDRGSGALAYDADGSGSGAAKVFAIIHNKAALTAADFIVI